MYDRMTFVSIPIDACAPFFPLIETHTTCAL